MRWLLAIVATVCSPVLHAQVLTWTPDFPTENNAAQSFVITVDATKGNQGLLNHTPGSDVYVHIGVITNLSTSSSDWKYVKFAWGSTTAQAQATYIVSNKWQYTINGSLRSFFGLTDPAESIRKVAILFRSGTGGKKQANADGSDMYIPVYTSDFAARLNAPPREPRFIPVAEPQNWTVGSTFNISGAANKPSTLKLYHNSTTPLVTVTNAQSVSASSSVTALGRQEIILEASDGSQTIYDTIQIFAGPTSSPVAALPTGVRDGINYHPDGSVTLVVHAPGKNIMTVIGDFTDWKEDLSYVMNKTPNGEKFWIRLTGLTPGTEYGFQYKVDNQLVIADPYAEKVLDPWNDPFIGSTTYPGLKPYPTGKTSGIVSVLQLSAPAYTWSNKAYSRPDKRTLIVYELLLRDFLAAHDWKTLRDTLNYLQKLGVNAIELMPFNEFEGNISWGYNSSFYFTPDKYYGPAKTLKEFIDTCHSRGIAVVMDIALNHSYGQSPMVQLYWDAANSRPAANNPWYNPVPKHAYNVGYDMNHESAATKYFTSRVVEHWLKEYKIDGFRFDLSKGFTQVNSCVSGNPACDQPADVSAWGNYDASRVAIWKAYHDTVQLKQPGAYVILEHFAENSEERELAAYGMLFWGNLHYNFTEASKGIIPNSNFSWGIHSTRGWTSPHLITYMESHDEERMMYQNKMNGVTTATYNIKHEDTALKRIELSAAFFLTIPGPKMIWQFGELGYDFPINYCENGSINNSCRTHPKPIKWDYLQSAKRKHVYDVFSKLIALRKLNSFRNSFIGGTVSHDLSDTLKWMTVNTDTAKLIVIGNFGVRTKTGNFNFPETGNWFGYLDSSVLSTTGTTQTLTLQPGEYRVYVNRNVHQVTVTSVDNVSAGSNQFRARVFPNPSKSAFYLHFELPRTAMTTIDVYNSLGQHMGIKKQAVMNAGLQKLSFDRKDVDLKAGIYFIRIQSGTFQQTLPLTVQ